MMKGLDLLGALSFDARAQMLASRPRPSTPASSAAGLAAAISAAARNAPPPAATSAASSAITAKPPSSVATAAAGPGLSAAAQAAQAAASSHLADTKKHAKDRSNAVAVRLQSAAAKVKKRKPTVAAKLTAHASRIRQKGATLIGWFNTVIGGIDLQNIAVDTSKLQAAAEAVLAASDAADSLVTAADIIDAVLSDVDRCSAANLIDLANAGVAVAQRTQDLIDNFNPDVMDVKTAPAVAGVSRDASAWSRQVQMALANTPAGGYPPSGDTTSPPPPGGGANAPSIQAVTNAMTGVPNSGNPGDQIIITGVNLGGATAVTFGGAPAQFTVNGPTQISATVPPNPAPGSVTVTTPYGSATSMQTFVLASASNYGGAAGGGGYGGGGYGGGDYGGGGGGFGGGGDDGYSDDDYAAAEAAAAAEQGLDDSDAYDDAGGYDAGGVPALPMPPPAPTPIVVVPWKNKDAYSTGDIVVYNKNYYRATRTIGSRWLFHNDAPDSSDAWAKLKLRKQADAAEPDTTLGFSSWDPWTIFYDPAGGLYRYMNQDADTAYQPRYVNTYWQTRAQSPIAASSASRLQLAQQLQQNLQSQLAARYAALSSQIQPSLVGESGMSRKIIGPALCGFADYFEDPVSVVGLSVRPLANLVSHIPQKGSLSHGVTVKRSPQGNAISSLHINPKVLHRRDPATVQHAAQLAVQRAQTVSKNVLNAVSHVEAQQKKGGKVTAPVVHGVGAAVAKRPPSARHVPAASLTQLKQQAQALQKSAGKLSDSATKYKKQTDQAKTRQGSAISHQKAITKLHGIFGIIGYDARGLSPGQPGYDPTTDPTAPGYGGGGGYVSTAPPDPNNPGYLTDGSPDPAYGPTGGGALPPSGVSQVAGPPDYGAGPSPTPDTSAPQPEIDYVPSSDLGSQDWAQFYTSDPSGTLPNGSMGSPVPLGAVYFDGSRPLPFKGVGNATVFYGTLPDGTTPKGGASSGYEWHGSGGFDWALVLQGSGGGYSGGKNYDKVSNPDMGMISESQKNGWGPLIGDPQQPGMSGLRFDVAKMAFFWPYDKAPDWAQAPVKQAAFNAAVVAWKAAQTAGQADYVAAQLQDKLDAQTAGANARQQAQQDLQLAMQQQKFEAMQAQQQATLDLQSQQDAQAYQAQQAQLDAQYAAADLQAQQAQTASDVAAQQMQDKLYYAQQQQALSAPQLPPGYDDGGAFVDQGGGGGGGSAFDDSDASPESASDQEAMDIDTAVADELVGASTTELSTLLRKQQMQDEGAVDGAGNVIGFDDYGNLVE